MNSSGVSPVTPSAPCTWMALSITLWRTRAPELEDGGEGGAVGAGREPFVRVHDPVVAVEARRRLHEGRVGARHLRLGEPDRRIDLAGDERLEPALLLLRRAVSPPAFAEREREPMLASQDDALLLQLNDTQSGASAQPTAFFETVRDLHPST